MGGAVQGLAYNQGVSWELTPGMHKYQHATITSAMTAECLSPAVHLNSVSQLQDLVTADCSCLKQTLACVFTRQLRASCLVDREQILSPGAF